MKPREVRDFPRRSWEGKSQSFVSCFLVPHEILPVTEKFPVETCGCVAIHWVTSSQVSTPVEKIMLRKITVSMTSYWASLHHPLAWGVLWASICLCLEWVTLITLGSSSLYIFQECCGCVLQSCFTVLCLCWICCQRSARASLCPWPCTSALCWAPLPEWGQWPHYVACHVAFGQGKPPAPNSGERGFQLQHLQATPITNFILLLYLQMNS